MAIEQMNHEGRISALEAQYKHLATKADLERLGKELSKEIGDKITSHTRWVAFLWITTIIALVGLIMTRTG